MYKKKTKKKNKKPQKKRKKYDDITPMDLAHSLCGRGTFSR